MNSAPPSVSVELLRARARAAWRRGRWLEAAPELLLVFSMIGLTWVVTSASRSFALAALSLVALTAIFVSTQHSSRRLVLPALLLGTLPLACALVAHALGQQCGTGHCATSCAAWCVPLCGAGGLGSGLLLARAARYEPKPWRAWLIGGGLILSAGALGCSCVGASGLAGAVLGFLPSAALLARLRA